MKTKLVVEFQNQSVTITRLSDIIFSKMAEKQEIVGYDFITKEPSPKAYECMICHLLILGFTELKCDHSFCKLFLERLEEKKKYLKGEEKKKRYIFNLTI